MEDMFDEAMEYMKETGMEFSIENLVFASQVLANKYRAIARFNKETITVDTEVL